MHERIFGLWNLDGEPIQSSLLARLSAVQAHRGLDGIGRWTEGSIGFHISESLDHSGVGGRDSTLVREDTVVLFDGRLDNRYEILATLKDERVSKDSSDAALVSRCT